MTSSDTLSAPGPLAEPVPQSPAAHRRDVLLLAARCSFRHYLTAYSPKVFAASVLPRVVLQVLFFSYIAYYTGGTAGRDFAYVGASVQVMTIATVVKGPWVLLDERPMGTLYRHRLGTVGLPAVVAARWWVYTAEGVLDSLIAAIAVGLLFGRTHLALELVAAAPLLALTAVTTSAFGLLVAGAAWATRAEVLVTNLGSYGLLALCGIAGPLHRLGPVLAAVAHLLPMTNGLLAVRAAVSGGPWLGHAAAEALVGAVWGAAGVWMLRSGERRARVRGTVESD